MTTTPETPRGLRKRAKNAIFILTTTTTDGRMYAQKVLTHIVVLLYCVAYVKGTAVGALSPRRALGFSPSSIVCVIVRDFPKRFMGSCVFVCVCVIIHETHASIHTHTRPHMPHVQMHVYIHTHPCARTLQQTRLLCSSRSS